LTSEEIDDDEDRLELRVVHEVRQLRLQLELCIGNNDQLRQRLEDCSCNHHSTYCSSCRRQLSTSPGQQATVSAMMNSVEVSKRFI